jgi:hypothetical protein
MMNSKRLYLTINSQEAIAGIEAAQNLIAAVPPLSTVYVPKGRQNHWPLQW